MAERTALVTGSAQGIGAAVAERLASAGLSVTGVDIREHGSTGFHTVVADISDPESCSTLVADVGPVDVLVNNAAVLIEQPIEAVTPDDFDHTTSVNLRAPFFLSQAVAPGMAERGWGRIVNVASVAARTGGVSQSCVYAMTKAGMVAMTKNFARNFGPHGVTANAVAPGAIATPMALGQFEADEELHRRVLSQLPVGRLGTPEEVATVVEFLARPESGFVNGVTVDVNGGWVMA